MITKGYDAAGLKVLRVGESITQTLSYIFVPIYLIKNDNYIRRKESFYFFILYWSFLGFATVYSFIVPKIKW